MWIALFMMMQIQINIGLPAIRFEEPPPLVVVEPGVYVVADYGEEVFFVDGWYWTRWHDGRWYRSRSYRGGWVFVQEPVVPVRLVRVPPGHYKHWGHGKPDKWRVANSDGSITEYQVKQKHGRTEWKVKDKGDKGDRGRYSPAPAPMPVYVSPGGAPPMPQQRGGGGPEGRGGGGKGHGHGHGKGK